MSTRRRKMARWSSGTTTARLEAKAGQGNDAVKRKRRKRPSAAAYAAAVEGLSPVVSRGKAEQAAR